MVLRSTWKLRWLYGGVIFYNRMKFRSNPFSLSKVNESSSRFGHIHSTVTVCKMKNETSFKIKTFLKGRVRLNVSVSQIYSDFLKEEKIVQLSHPTYSLDLSPCDFFLSPLLNKTRISRRYELRNALGSAMHPCFKVYLKGLLLRV